MATKTTSTKKQTSEIPESQTQTPEQTPESNCESFDDSLLYAENDEGQRVADSEVEQILADVGRVRTLRFRAGGATHAAEVRVSQLTHETREAPRALAQAMLLAHQIEHGYQVPPLEEAELVEFLNDNPDTARRLNEASEAVRDSREYQLAQARVALECLVQDKQRRWRVSVPHWRDDLSAERIVDDPIFGTAFLDAVKSDVERFFG